MIRLFHAYFPTRTVLLTLTEAILLIAAFLLAVLVAAGTATNASIFLLYENGIGRIAFIVTVVLVMIYYFDLYSSMILSPAGRSTGVHVSCIGACVLCGSRR